MEGADLIKMVPAEKPKIPEALIQATMDSIKAGVRLDEKVLEAQAAKEAAKLNKGKKKEERRHAHLLKRESEDEFIERNYRAHEDRRFGFLIIGDQHRLTGLQGNESQINHAPPLDYSFCLLNTVEEIITEQEIPQTRRSYKQPVKTNDDRYITASLRMSYNVLRNFDGLVNVLYKILDAGPFGLCWLDLSFNSLTSLDEDTLGQLPNLKILYLHGNSLEDMTEIPKLTNLTSLISLTLHGNPIEEDESYRISVLYFLKDLKLQHLDFIGITKGDRASADKFGRGTIGHWARKHLELEAKTKLLKENLEMSLTAKLLQSSADYNSDSD